jgi:hypothetical protein
MLNPLDVEQYYQNLRLTLSLPATSFQRLCAITTFLDGLSGEEPAFESYILDCLDQVPMLVRELSRAGYDPEVLRKVHERLCLAADSVQNANPMAGVREALGELRETVCGLYAYGAAWEKLRGMLGMPVREQDTTEPGRPAGSRRAVLTRMAEESDDHNVCETLERLSRVWDIAVKPHSGIAHVPVVEKSLGEEIKGVGSLRRLTVKIFGESGDGHDAIHGDMAVFGVDREETGLTEIPLQAARSVLRNMDSALAEKHFAGQITIGNGHELHEGDSARLAAMTLLVCGILRYANRRIQYRLRSDAALTGSMNANGGVLDVDTGSLEAKVTAAFFSHVETLVVPRGQALDAEGAGRELQERYPGRHLDIVGVAHAREVFFDRRVVEEVRLPMAVHLARSMARRKMPIIAALTSLALLFVAGRLVFGPIDRTPADVEFLGNVMNVENRYGEVVSSVAVDVNTVAFQESQSKTSTFLPRFGVMCDDGKDSDAVVFIGCSRLDATSADEVRRWSIARQRYDWIWHPVPVVDFPRKNYEARGSAHLACLVAFAEVDTVPGREILVVSHHPNSFPGVLTVLDRHTGNPIAEYLHVGFINDIKLYDIDGDSIEEILLCGINNAYRMAFVAVLDPRRIGGCSPTKGEYVCASHQPAAEKYYVLIPRTIVGEASRLWKNNNAASIVIDQTCSQIIVRVEDALGNADSTGEIVMASLNYRFDSTMRVLTIAPGDTYDLLAEGLTKRGALQRKPDYAYFEAEKKKMRYWTGEGWSHTVTRNRRYNVSDLAPAQSVERETSIGIETRTR